MKSSFIEIKNYRCFQETRIDDLGLVNVFGGLNNVGKTTLLEAIYLLNTPSAKALQENFEYRETIKNLYQLPESERFKSLFYDKKRAIRIQNDTNWEFIIYEDEKERELVGLFDFEVGSFEEPNMNYLDLDIFYIPGDRKSDFLYFKLDASNEKFESKTHIPARTDDKWYGGEFVLLNNKIQFVRTQSINSQLPSLFDKSILSGNELHLIEAFRLISSEVQDVRTLNQALHIKENGKGYRPLALYGDAMNRIAEFVLRIVDCAGGTLLIDEIENGIHYTNHKKVWSLLFQLAEKFEVQIFATSHSAEMINAFNEVALAHKTDQMRYFEMYRHETSGQIKAKWQKSNVLQNKIESEVDFRGVVS